MLVNGQPYRTIWITGANRLAVIDQTALPHEFKIVALSGLDDVCRAITSMQVRGAGLIGATAAYGMWLAALDGPDDPSDFSQYMRACAKALLSTRPTASNLQRAVRRQLTVLQGLSKSGAMLASRREAESIADEDAEFCRRIGEHGLSVIKKLAVKTERAIHILTHCNAGWLAFVDYGSALAPVYAAHDAGLDVHVWVDETRPRNQGAALTAWELERHGVPHDLITDNAGGHLMRQGMVDLVITGADRVTRRGDTANKIGTYLKALAARDNDIPFYVALPSSTFDFQLTNEADIPIEERSPDEVRKIGGLAPDGSRQEILLCPAGTPARNWSFDVTPARLITGLITERGVCAATEQDITALFPAQRHE